MALKKEWVERLFVHLKRIYGDRFKVNPDDWVAQIIIADALDGLQPPELSMGVKRCELYKHDPIPSPIQLWHYCKGLHYSIRTRKTEWNKSRR